MKIRIIASAAALLAALFICPDALSADNPDGKPKNIILFIGDGMSVPQREAAEEYSKATRARGLYLNEMPFSSATVTRSANNTVTDSAASGTAIACGVKTNNGRIGVDPNWNELV